MQVSDDKKQIFLNKILYQSPGLEQKPYSHHNRTSRLIPSASHDELEFTATQLVWVPAAVELQLLLFVV